MGAYALILSVLLGACAMALVTITVLLVSAFRGIRQDQHSSAPRALSGEDRAMHLRRYAQQR
jgi:hypothetical protein